MFRKDFLHGIIAGVLASISGIIFDHVYYFANGANFSKIVNIYSIISFNIFICLIIAIIHSVFVKFLKQNAEISFNLTLSILTVSMILIPIAINLPLDIRFPELFPGLVIPILFFPALAWFTLNPLFDSSDKKPGV